MSDMIRMVIVLTVLSAFSGGLLAAVREGTKEKIEVQQLTYVKGPAIKEILAGASNDPIEDRFKMRDGAVERDFFVGRFDGKTNTVAFESSGTGYGGDIGVMIGVDIEQDRIVGVAVTTHSETPGVGSRAKTDPKFTAQFRGQPIKETFRVKADGGQVDAIAGATVTSRAVAAAVTDAVKVYGQMKPAISDNLKRFSK
jgi:Na+-translocating ferredoxin:NAD+ oxidoreductase subunit G